MIRLRPLTERLVDRLPGPAWTWIGVWASVPWLNAAANALTGTGSAIWDRSLTLALVNYAFISAAVVITVWGSSRIAHQVETLRAASVNGGKACCDRFQEMNSIAAPLVGAAVVSLAFATAAFHRDGWGSALLRGGTWFVLGVALCTFLWTYVTLQLGLDRLGRRRLSPDASIVDPSLGLRPLGAVAFTGFWMLVVWLVPSSGRVFPTSWGS